MTHSELIDAIILEASERNLARLFRNPSGQAVHRKNGKTWHVKYGCGLTAQSAGLDLIGWTMRGQFVALDAKVGRDKLSVAQQTFIRWVLHGGGIAGEFRSVEEGLALITAGL